MLAAVRGDHECSKASLWLGYEDVKSVGILAPHHGGAYRPLNRQQAVFFGVVCVVPHQFPAMEAARAGEVRAADIPPAAMMVFDDQPADHLRVGGQPPVSSNGARRDYTSHACGNSSILFVLPVRRCCCPISASEEEHLQKIGGNRSSVGAVP